MNNFIKVACKFVDAQDQPVRGSITRVVSLNIDLIAAIDNDHVYLKTEFLFLNGYKFNRFSLVDKNWVN